MNANLDAKQYEAPTPNETLDKIINELKRLIGEDIKLEPDAHDFDDLTSQEFAKYVTDITKPTIKDECVLGIYDINDAILYRQINQLQTKDQNYDPFSEEDNNF
ncbi:hypothetical protein J6W20_05465 [bacterium]|nr:hypothetical protein [bacterium]